MSGYPTDRTGHGRWCTITSPAAGVLWESDAGSVGFQAVPLPEVDGTTVTDLLDTYAEAGRTSTEAFDHIARIAGAQGVKTGDLTHWTPDSQRASRLRSTAPSAEVVAALAAMGGGGHA